MRKIFLSLLIVVLLSSCVSLVPQRKLKEWALSNGYVLASDIPEVTVPEREAQPHPSVPKIEIYDSSGNPISLTKPYLMEIIVSLFGTVEKYQYLVEIYEREYLNAGGKIMPNLTLEELKKLYLSRVQSETTTSKFMTGSKTESEMTVEEFAILVQAWNQAEE